MSEQDNEIQELIDFVAIAKWNGKRIAFWGWDPTILSALEREKLLDNLDTIFITEDFPVQDMRKCRITQEYHAVDQNYHKPEQLLEFKPDKVCILYSNTRQTIRIYEDLLRKYELNPMDIFTTRNIWRVADYEKGNSYLNLVSSVPSTIVGGLIPKSSLSLYDGLRYITENKVPGRVINFGVSRGWSMYFIAKTLQHLGDSERPIIGFDSFSGFPQNASRYDLCHIRYKPHFSKLTPDQIKNNKFLTEQNLTPFRKRITLIDGDVNETISQLGNEPIALALFDMDDYTPTKVSLEPTFQLLSPNGIFVLDHFTYDSIGGFCVGQRIAMLEFLERHPMFGLTGTNMFFKTAS